MTAGQWTGAFIDICAPSIMHRINLYRMKVHVQGANKHLYKAMAFSDDKKRELWNRQKEHHRSNVCMDSRGGGARGGITREDSAGSAVSALSTQTMQTELKNSADCADPGESEQLSDGDNRFSDGLTERLSDGLTSEGGSANDGNGGMEPSSSPGLLPEFPEEGDCPSNCTLLAL